MESTIFQEYNIENTDSIISINESNIIDSNKNIFSTKTQAHSHGIAAPMLTQLMKHARDSYQEGWTPDWGNYDDEKYVIRMMNDGLDYYESFNEKYFLSFPTEDIRDKFMDTHHELIKEYFNGY
jgi:hypothetical protein